MSAQARLLTVTVVVHVLAVLSLLVAIAAGAGVALLVALVGGVAASVVWVVAAHNLVDQVVALRPAAPLRPAESIRPRAIA